MRLGLRDKLLAGFGVVLALTAIVGYVGWRNTIDFADDSRTIYDDRLLPLEQLGNVQQGLYELRLGGLYPTYASADDATRARIKVDDQRWLKQIDDAIKVEEASGQTPMEADLLRQWHDAYPAFLRAREQVMSMVDQGKLAEAAAIRAGELAQSTA